MSHCDFDSSVDGLVGSQMDPDITPEAVARMLDGVTEWPWCSGAGRDDPTAISFGPRHVASSGGFQDGQPDTRRQNEANARFIAWAREAVPALAAKLADAGARVAELTAENERLRDLRDIVASGPFRGQLMTHWIEDKINLATALKGDKP